MHECDVVPILLFEHVFYTREVTRYGTYKFMKFYSVCVCVCVHSHILKTHGVGWGG